MTIDIFVQEDNRCPKYYIRRHEVTEVQLMIE